MSAGLGDRVRLSFEVWVGGGATNALLPSAAGAEAVAAVSASAAAFLSCRSTCRLDPRSDTFNFIAEFDSDNNAGGEEVVAAEDEESPANACVDDEPDPTVAVVNGRFGEGVKRGVTRVVCGNCLDGEGCG